MTTTLGREPDKPDTSLKDFTPEFQDQILAYLLKPDASRGVQRLIKPEYFVGLFGREIAQIVHEHRDRYQTTPLEGDLVEEATRKGILQNGHAEQLKGIYHLSRNGLKKTEDEIIRWARESAIRLAFLKSLDLFEDRSDAAMPEIISEFEDVLSIGRIYDDLGTDLLGDLSWMNTPTNYRNLRTPWEPINRVISGGLDVGELGFILAPSGGQKTTALINMGITAANLTNRRNVLHFTLEMTEARVRQRYSERLVGRPFNYNDDPATFARDLDSAAKRMLSGGIRIKQFPSGLATIHDLRDVVERCVESGFKPDLIIVDYPHLMKPARNQRERRFEFQEIDVAVRAMGAQYNAVVWAGLQSTRETKYRASISDADIAEDYGASRTADCILSIPRTRKEEEHEAGRITVAKARWGEPSGQLACRFEFPSIIGVRMVKDADECVYAVVEQRIARKMRIDLTDMTEKESTMLKFAVQKAIGEDQGKED